MANDIDSSALVGGLYKNKSKLEDAASGSNYLGGLHIGGLGIPSQMFGFDLRTQGQKEKAAAPGEYEAAMRSFLNSLRECLNAANSPYPG